MSAKYPLAGNSLLVEVEGGVATVTLNRPKQHNALTRELRTNLGIALESLQADDDVDVIILTGAGDKSFCVGLDLKEFESSPMTPDEVGTDTRVARGFAALTKPVIAAINGYVVTGGFELVLNCDIRVCTPNTTFADTHVRVGVLPGWGGSQLLVQAVGPARAAYIGLTGNYVDAATAKAWGLVLDVLPREELMPYCREIAQDIVSADQGTVREYRALMREGVRTTVQDGLALETKLGKARLARFDIADFRRTREAVMNRGKTQNQSGE
ncbi:MAG: enoyl-CoA hydratase [Burkholderiales bacterium]